MAFPVKLFSFTKDANSTKQPTNGVVYQCTTNRDFSIQNPVIRLNIGPAANPQTYNYLYVQSWGRYYWIDDWTFEGGLWCAHCSVDPLASFKTAIGNGTAYVLRAASEWDGSIIDGMYPMHSASTTELQTGTNPWSLDPKDGTFVVGIAGSGATQFIMFNAKSLDLFFQWIFSDTYAVDALGALALATNPELKVQLNPIQYITSIVWLPFKAVGTAVNTVKVGLVNVDIAGFDIGSGRGIGTTKFDMHRHPDSAARGSWVNAGAASYSLFYPPFGLIPLDPVQCANTTAINCDTVVDYRTGHATMTVTSDTGILSRVSAMVGLSYPVSNVVSPGWGVSSILATLGGTVANAYTGNIPGALTGGLSAIESAAAAKIPHVSTIGGTSATDGLVGKPAVLYEWMRPVEDDIAHRGRPLCKVKTINSLSGYILCADVHPTIPNATKSEVDAIIAYMQGGFYYE